jgi:ABC-type sulfate transport system permease component
MGKSDPILLSQTGRQPDRSVLPVESARPRPWGKWTVRSLALSYLTAILIIPLVVIFRDGLQAGLSGLWHQVTLPAAWSALKLTLWTAAVMTLINTLMGAVTAYVLIRYDCGNRF